MPGMRLLLPLLFAATTALAAVELPELRERPHDILILRAGNERLLGTIVKIDDSGTVFFREKGTEAGHVGHPKGSYTEISRRRMAADIIRRRLTLIRRHEDITNRGKRAEETLAWGLKKGEDELVAELAASTAAAIPESIDLARWVIEHFGTDTEGLVELEGMIAAVVAANPNWIEGREHLIRIHHATDEYAKLQKQLGILRKRHPQHLLANRIAGELAYAAGELEKAHSAFRIVTGRAPEDQAARVGYAKCSFLLGEFRSAADAAAELLEADAYRRDAAAILGSLALREGDDEEALRHLQVALDVVDAAEAADGSDDVEEGDGGDDNAATTSPAGDDERSAPVAVASDLDSRIAPIARSNLALAYLRTGRRTRAAAIWADLDGEYATVGRAVAAGRPLAADRLEHPHLRTVANEHNLCLELQQGDPDLEGLQDRLSVGRIPRHTFLDRVATMVAQGGARPAVRAVLKLGESGNEREALRWAAYGHLLAKRYSEADELLGRLPADDGYAAVYRVYIASARKDLEGAKSIYKKQVEPLASRQNTEVAPPAAYVQSLAAHFDVAQGKFRRFDFDIGDGAILGPSWRSEAPGTGIRIHIADERLVFTGTQLESRSPVSRAWCTTLKSQLHEAWLFFDASEAEGAMVGLEILDATLTDGVGVGVDGDRELRWRRIVKGRPGRWQAFSPRRRLPADKPLRLKFLSGNRVALVGGNTAENIFVGDPLDVRNKAAIAIFGEAPPGTGWRLSVDRLDLR